MNGLSIRIVRWSLTARCCAVTLFALLGSTSLLQAAPLVQVNGETITLADLDELLASQQWPGVLQKVPASLSADGLIQRMIQNRLLEQEGYRIEAEKRPTVRNQVWDLRRHRGMLALLDSVSAEAHSYEAEELVAALQQTNTMQQISQILLRDEATARAMVDSLAAGAVFAGLADRHSVDTTSVIGAGGTIGWVRKDRFIPEFSAALDGLSKDDYTEAFQTEVGWHVLQLNGTREETVGQSDAMVQAVKEKARGQQVMGAVRTYIESLMEEQGVVVDSSLLASLDYGSEDPAVSAALQANYELLTKLPWREITVRDLSLEIRFQHFHGLDGKPDAAELRDKVFDEWLTQLLLRHEATALGFDRTPELLAMAEALEQRLVREAVLNMILDIKFTPTEDEIQEYYERHLPQFSSAPRVRANGVLVSNADVAKTLREMLGQGARMNWLADNTPDVVDPNPSIFKGWIDPASLELSAGEAVGGLVLDPIQVGDAWAVVEILEVEKTEPLPLVECRNMVLKRLMGETRSEAVRKAVLQLESAAEIAIEKDAPQLVNARIETWLGIPEENRQP